MRTFPLPGWLRLPIQGLDALLRRGYGIQTFTQDARCIFRIAFRTARQPRVLHDGTAVHPGDPILELHYWNEHLPPMGPQGPDFDWAAAFMSRLRHSLRLLARFVATDSRARDVVALYGRALLPGHDTRQANVRILERMGFTIFPVAPARTPWQRFARFWVKAYTWALIWTYNPHSLQAHTFAHDWLAEIWMSRKGLEAWLREPPAHGEGGRHP